VGGRELGNNCACTGTLRGRLLTTWARRLALYVVASCAPGIVLAGLEVTRPVSRSLAAVLVAAEVSTVGALAVWCVWIYATSGRILLPDRLAFSAGFVAIQYAIFQPVMWARIVGSLNFVYCVVVGAFFAVRPRVIEGSRATVNSPLRPSNGSETNVGDYE
jgi:hypothetical protein